MVLVAALGLFGGLIWISLRARLLSEVDEDLVDQARSFQSFVQAEAKEVSGAQLKEEIAEFCQALPQSSFLELRDASGQVVFRYTTRSYAQGVPGFPRTIQRDMTAEGVRYRFEIGTSLRSIQHTLELLGALLLGLIPVVIAIACAG